uniref:Variant surface glycoprotein 1125.261 n=1 Tax=Trypanosoma brucei TaxID=5691 RepID=A0A1J0R5K8_9TRYP|nr:variant surface glycoprotein 1125.261 [Trypanosoma brucei]
MKMDRTHAALSTQMLCIFSVVLQDVVTANVEPGDNGGYYASTCAILNMLLGATAQTDNQGEVQKIATEIGAINLSVADEAFRKLIKHDADWDGAPIKAEHESKEYPPDWKAKYPFWRAAKQKLHSSPDQFKQWQEGKLSTSAKHQLRQLAEQAYADYSDRTLQEFPNLKRELDERINEAVYGTKTSGDDTQTPVGTARATVCGATNGDAGTGAGSSLKHDLLCLCGAVSNDLGKVCCEQCGTAAANAWGAAGTVAAAWQPIKDNCPAHAGTSVLTTANLQQAVSAFYTAISKKQSTTRKKQYVLGLLSGDGTSGCAGTSANNGGACVIYKNAAAGGKTSVSIPWADKALKAAETADKLIKRQGTIQRLEDRLRLLNVSVAALIHNIADQASAQAAASDTSDNTSPGQQTKSESECNAAKDNQEACKKIEYKGCVFDSEGEKGKKCTLSEQAKKAAENAAAAGAGDGTAGTTGKCSAVQTLDDCAKVPGTIPQGKKAFCRWRSGKYNKDKKDEGKFCDSSFFVNKKLVTTAAALVNLVSF